MAECGSVDPIGLTYGEKDGVTTLACLLV